MKVTPIKTRLVRANDCSLEELLGESITELEENSVVTITSKVVALCQGRVIDAGASTKTDLIEQEADYYAPEEYNRYGFHLTIINNTLISSAGIDTSNTDGYYVLWPKNPQQVANDVRAFLSRRFNRQDIGVIITDSSSMPPMRQGTIGIMLAHSGFKAIKHLAGTNDLFMRPFKISTSAIGSGLAATATVAMGEGTEQTPIAIISDIPFVTFQHTDPAPEELAEVYIKPEDDLYSALLLSIPWQKGKGGTAS